MSKKRYLIIGIAVTSGIAIFLSVLFFQSSGKLPGNERMPEESTVSGIGFSYLQVTPGISEYYNLEVDSGALVTEVIQGSLADKAGLAAGDVILSFNGTVIDSRTPLLTMVMACRFGHVTEMEITRDKIINTITLDHTQQ